MAASQLERISAVTLFTADMARAVAFYRALGFVVRYGGPDDEFTSLQVGTGYLNLMLARPEDRPWLARPEPDRTWGRVILHVSDVDAMYRRACAAGLSPDGEPADAPWQERFFHLRDPDGHELSFARPLESGTTAAE